MSGEGNGTGRKRSNSTGSLLTAQRMRLAEEHDRRAADLAAMRERNMRELDDALRSKSMDRLRGWADMTKDTDVIQFGMTEDRARLLLDFCDNDENDSLVNAIVVVVSVRPFGPQDFHINMYNAIIESGRRRGMDRVLEQLLVRDKLSFDFGLSATRFFTEDVDPRHPLPYNRDVVVMLSNAFLCNSGMEWCYALEHVVNANDWELARLLVHKFAPYFAGRTLTHHKSHELSDDDALELWKICAAADMVCVPSQLDKTFVRALENMDIAEFMLANTNPKLNRHAEFVSKLLDRGSRLDVERLWGLIYPFIEPDYFDCMTAVHQWEFRTWIAGKFARNFPEEQKFYLGFSSIYGRDKVYLTNTDMFRFLLLLHPMNGSLTTAAADFLLSNFGMKPQNPQYWPQEMFEWASWHDISTD